MVGRVFMGRYQATRLLGEGGMGRVYLARQLDLGRQVVVKVMHDHIAADPQFCERFQRETLLMARFQHPYAVTLYDASLNDPQGPCIIMEFIRGITLDALLVNNGRLSGPRAGRLLGQLCEVLQAAHTEGIVHRDLKPANLMVVDPDSPYEKIKVMDFGLATLVNPASLKKLTESEPEFAVGTPGYMCPEQVRGEEMDHRGDLYSVGVMLYELLSGKLPFAGRSSMSVLLAHATEEPPLFADIGAGNWVSPGLEAVIRSCLAKDAAARPQNARELAERYEIALEHDLAGLPGPAAAEASPPASVAEAEVTPVTAPTFDPLAVVHELDAWMPEEIASYKLRGFVQDVGGRVLESVPGRIRVRLGGPGSVYVAMGNGPLRWLGLGRRSGELDMELQFRRTGIERRSLLHITVAMRAVNATTVVDPAWRARCNQIYCDLRGYLMGKNGPLSDAAG
jgi:serine/threonine-protein kinase